MDENNTNETTTETTGENTSEAIHETTNDPIRDEWIAQYANKEIYPKKPIPAIVYVLSVLAGFGVTWFLHQYMALQAESLGKVEVLNSVLVWLMFFVLFLASSCLFVLLYKCVVHYGFWETTILIPKAVLLTASIVALGVLVFFLCISEYFGSVIVGLFLVPTIYSSIQKSRRNPT